MSISAQLVKELRSKTGAGILDSKKALEATNSNVEQAIEWLKEKGIAKAAKKASRIAAEGLALTLVNGNSAIILEMNSETDFVALNEEFKALVNKVGNALLLTDFNNTEEALKVSIDGKTIEQLAIDATSTIGEKIAFRRAEKFTKTDSQNFGAYVHSNNQIASLVIIENGTKEVAKNVSMHVAAMDPKFMSQEQIPSEIVEKHKLEIKKNMLEDESNSKKPENIIEQISKGKLKKVLSEISLVDQPFVMETKLSVSQYLNNNNAKVVFIKRFEVGEGIEKVVVDFASEVAEQMK